MTVTTIGPADFDRDVRVAIAQFVRDHAAIPSAADVAARLDATTADVKAAFDRLFAARVLILKPGTREILAFDPFAAGPTAFPVRAAEHDWWAICAWDALGVPAALHSDAVIGASCGDCGEPLDVRVADGAASGPAGTVMQVGVPALQFWQDIVFT